MKKLRVPLPRRKPGEQIALAKRLLQKHLTDGEQSPLRLLDWKSLEAEIHQAEQWHKEGETLRTHAAQKLKDRDNALTNIYLAIQSSRDILTGMNISNMKYLSDWGFDVIESPAKKQRDSFKN